MCKKNNFLFRKIHSLLGIFPIGVFLIEHLITNSFAMRGEAIYDEKIAWLQGLPYLLFLEMSLILIPILLHAGLGIVYLWGWRDNSIQYRYPRNFLYTFQRVTGIMAVIFILYHVWEFRILTYLNDVPVNFSLVKTTLASPMVFYFYFVGVISTIFHFSNGIWGFLIHWGITLGPRSQKVSGVVCAGAGILLLYIGLDALFAFVG